MNLRIIILICVSILFMTENAWTQDRGTRSSSSTSSREAGTSSRTSQSNGSRANSSRVESSSAGRGSDRNNSRGTSSSSRNSNSNRGEGVSARPFTPEKSPSVNTNTRPSPTEARGQSSRNPSTDIRGNAHGNYNNDRNDRGNSDRHSSSNEYRNNRRFNPQSSAARRGYSYNDRRMESRHNYAPMHSLPSGCKVYNHNNHRFYCNNGVFYRYYRDRYYVSYTPFGVRLSVLPRGYVHIYFGSIPYYYFKGILYRSVPYSRIYEVVQPEIGMVFPYIPFEYADRVRLRGELFYELDGYLYQPINTPYGIQYRVEGCWYD